MHEVTRLLYETPEIRNPSAAAFLQRLRQAPRDRTASPRVPTEAADVIPVPLDAEIWSSAVFRRKVPPEQLVHAILADRQAALLCHGLTRLDDGTLEYFAAHPALVTQVYERAAGLFAAFSSGIRIHDNRVAPPGDADAVSLWETVLGERVTRPERFVPALLEAADGRLAYIYDVAANVDPPRRAFVLGAWMAPPLRLERFRRLAGEGVASMREWHARLLPFNRGSYDFAMAIARLAVRDDGTPLPPASRRLWARVFGTAEPAGDEPLDAAWMLENVVGADVRQRGDRLDTLAFAQRIAADGGGDGERWESEDDLAFVLRALPKYRGLALSFERAGFKTPAVYAAAIRHAQRLALFDGRRGYVIQAQFQGALAIVARLMSVGTIDVAAGEQLVAQLAELPIANGYAGGVAQWIRARLLPRLPAARDIEGALVAGLAGVAADADAPRVAWEGQVYRLDLAASERQRLERVREKQRAPRLDIPLQMAEAAAQLKNDAVTADDIADAALQFEAIAADLPRRSREEDADSVPAGVAPPPSIDALKRAAEELAKAAKVRDVKRVAKIAEPIVELADDLLGRNLLSLAYALSLGDPDGTVLLAADVSHRHDFGFGVKDPEIRGRITWAIPRQEIAPGTAWHVSGSLLALDAGLATLSLRRVATDHVLEAPKLTNNARDTFATSVALLDPLALRDADRDAIAAAIARGTDRARAATTAAAIDAIADQVRLDAARRHALKWTVAHDPDRALSMYSLTELLLLGGADPAAFHAWGMAVVPASGCLCSRLLPPSAWALLAGRPQLGLEAAILPDLNLRIAVVLKELELPAALLRVVLSGAMQDLIDEARPTNDSDWLSIARAARAVTRERVEDYVAAATATGPLMPESSRSQQPRP